MINGDLVEKPRADLFNNFLNLTAAIESPVLLVHGNHDGKPPFTLFLDAQARVSGFQSLYYSFDVGGWHYVVLPAFPEQIPEEIAPQMLAWLAADMEANQFKNTMVFTHFPYMPQGLTQLEYYVQNPLELRLQILDELLKYGNTKYWFAGHVHNGIQNSVKTAWEYRGAKFITVPTVVRPRNFGEEYPTFREGLGKGGYFLTVNVNQSDVSILGRRAEQQRTFRYPDNFPLFAPEIEPRWLSRAIDLPAQPFHNGSFETGLQGWQKVWRYQTDSQPGFVTETSHRLSTDGRRSLLLGVREKGQAWANDELTEVYQIVPVQPGRSPILSLDYYAEEISKIGGGYIRLHAYKNSTHQATMIFYFGHNGVDANVSNIGKIFLLTGTGQFGTNRSFRELIQQNQVMFWDLSETEDRWHHLRVDIKSLFEKAAQFTGQSTFDADKLFIALGAWNSIIPNSETQILFDNVKLQWREKPSVSVHNDEKLVVSRDIFEPRFARPVRSRVRGLTEHTSDSLLRQRNRTDGKDQLLGLDDNSPLVGREIVRGKVAQGEIWTGETDAHFHSPPVHSPLDGARENDPLTLRQSMQDWSAFSSAHTFWEQQLEMSYAEELMSTSNNRMVQEGLHHIWGSSDAQILTIHHLQSST